MRIIINALVSFILVCSWALSAVASPGQFRESSVTVGRLTLLIDTSGSMSGKRLEDAKGAALKVVRMVNARVREINREEQAEDLFRISISVLGFGGLSEVRPFTSQMDFNTSEQSQAEAVRAMATNGATPLAPAVFQTVERMLSKSQTDSGKAGFMDPEFTKNNNAVILLSDGGDTTSSFQETMNQLRSLLRRSGITVPVYAVGLGLGKGCGTTQLQNIADITGGEASFVEESGALRDVFSDIAGRWLEKVAVGLQEAETRFSSQYPQYFSFPDTPAVSQKDRDFFSDGFFDE